MNISFINGSPKTGNSCSKMLLDQLQSDLQIKAQATDSEHAPLITSYLINRAPLSESDLVEITKSDIIVVGFPLYVDGIPSHMIAALYQLEDAFATCTSGQKTTFYGIINNGFSEGIQNQHAAKMLELFCRRAGISFGQVFATGAGEMIRTMLEMHMPFGKSSLSFLKENWDQFVDHIYHQTSAPNVFCSPKMPAFLFRLVGNHSFWNAEARKNGITRKQLNARRVYTPEQ